MRRLVSTTQDYAWGSPTAIPELLGEAATGRPVAELWLGAHPSAPSRVDVDGAPVPLDALVAGDPEGALGADVVARFGPALPYLLKVLAADAPLSLQVHPRRDQAEAGFAAEEAAGVPVTAPRRNYKDRNHKPELVYALTPFEALCGFRSAAGAAAVLAGLDAPLARDLHAICQGGHDAVERAVRHLLTGTPSAEVAAVADACRARAGHGSPDPGADHWVARFADAYPADPGVVVSLLLNRVTLQPGQAMFVDAGVVHAYLRGVGVEVMASSDNVLRAGLTAKHVDVPELLATIDFSAPSHMIAPEVVGPTAVFRVPVDDFVLSVTTAHDDGAHDDGAHDDGAHDDGAHALAGTGPRILLCLDGELTVRTADQVVVLDRGGAAFVPASDGALTLSGRGTLVQADVP